MSRKVGGVDSGKRARASGVACGERKSEFVRRGFMSKGTMEPPQHSAVARTNHIVTQPQMPSLVGINTHQQAPSRPAMACAQSS